MMTLNLIIAASAVGNDISIYKNSMNEAFKMVLKKDKPANQCEMVDSSLMIDCPTDYNIVDDVKYPYCEFTETVAPGTACGGYEYDGLCYDYVKLPECPVGYTLSKDKKNCYDAEFLPVDVICPTDYILTQGKKGQYCEKTTIECEEVCPAGSIVSGDDCLEEERLLPNICPDGYELSEDGTYCFKTIEKPCDKKDYIDDKKHLRRRLLENDYHSHDVKYVKAIDKSHFAKKAQFDDKLSEEKKSKDFVVQRLVEKGLCTFEEIVPSIEQFITVEVAKETICRDIVDWENIEFVCPDGFDQVEQKFKKIPYCAKTADAALQCLDGLKEFKKKCYQEIPEEITCPVGYRLVNDVCEKVLIKPPTYHWMLARECIGYKCVDYYENSCLFK